MRTSSTRRSSATARRRSTTATAEAEGATAKIAIGVGINTGIFSVLNGMVFRGLPVPDAREIVGVAQRSTSHGVVALVLKQTLRPVVIGAALGLLAGLGAARTTTATVRRTCRLALRNARTLAVPWALFEKDSTGLARRRGATICRACVRYLGEPPNESW